MIVPGFFFIMTYILWSNYRIKRKADHILHHLVVDIWRINMSWDDYLAKIYYETVIAGSFSGPEKLYSYVRQERKYVLGKNKIRKWLQIQKAYSLQRGVQRRFKKNKVIALGNDDQCEVDLTAIWKYKKESDGVFFVLVVIYIFFEFFWINLFRTRKVKVSL